jgi:hypothetical protein
LRRKSRPFSSYFSVVDPDPVGISIILADLDPYPFQPNGKLISNYTFSRNFQNIVQNMTSVTLTRKMKQCKLARPLL